MTAPFGIVTAYDGSSYIQVKIKLPKLGQEFIVWPRTLGTIISSNSGRLTAVDNAEFLMKERDLIREIKDHASDVEKRKTASPGGALTAEESNAIYQIIEVLSLIDEER